MLRRLTVPALAGVLLASTTASADILWKGDFETNDLSQWGSPLNLKTGQRTNITVIGSTVHEGKYAAQLVVHPDDLWPNGHNRVELHEDGKRTGEGQTTYFSWYFRLPVDITVHEDIGYWETNGPDYQQTMAFFLDPKNGATQIGFRTNKPTSKTHWTAPLSVGAWHQLAMEIFWTQTATNGKVAVWLDGALVVDHVTAQTKPNAADVFIQVGYHRDATNPSVDTIFIDDAREGTTLDDVLDKGAVGDGGSAGAAEAGEAGVGDASVGAGAGGSTTGAGGSGMGSGGSAGVAGVGLDNFGGNVVTSAGAGGSGGGRTGPAVADSMDGGCSCALPRSRGDARWAWYVLAAVGAAARRRKR